MTDNKEYKFIVILMLTTFFAGLISGCGFTISVVISFAGTFSLVGAILLANLLFGDKEFGIGHYILIAVIISVVALLLSST